jgi:hypothetical protein
MRCATNWRRTEFVQALPDRPVGATRTEERAGIVTRDWDLIRTLLLEVEAIDSTRGYIDSRHFAREHSVSESVAFHQFEILRERGLIEGNELTSMDGSSITARSLTWEGHELLDKMREPKLWGRIKDEATTRGIGLSFESLGALFTKLVSIAVSNVMQ